LGNDIEGINQFRANETIISKYGSNVTGEQRKKAEEALTAAILRDTQIRTKAAETASKKEESANNKAQKAAERKQRNFRKRLMATTRR
jgi:vacuolar-type H+-ATPase subunit E/Vma4